MSTRDEIYDRIISRQNAEESALMNEEREKLEQTIADIMWQSDMGFDSQVSEIARIVENAYEKGKSDEYVCSECGYSPKRPL